MALDTRGHCILIFKSAVEFMPLESSVEPYITDKQAEVTVFLFNTETILKPNIHILFILLRDPVLKPHMHHVLYMLCKP